MVGPNEAESSSRAVVSSLGQETTPEQSAGLLRVSCGKMVGGRAERASLRKKMLVLRMLKEAQTRPARLVFSLVGTSRV